MSETATSGGRYTAAEIAEARETRRNPRLTRFDGLHLRRLLEDLERALAAVPAPVGDVLDVFCGARPYDDLMPAGSRCVGYDFDDSYGVADVVGGDFLPFDDASFDLVTCIEGFQYVPDPIKREREIRRVTRPGGSVLIAVPLIWEYDRRLLEHRYTGPEIAALFSAWTDVEVTENGGRGVAWALITGHLLTALALAAPSPLRVLTRPLLAAACLIVNLIGGAVDRIDGRHQGSMTLPVNLMLSARKPAA